MAVRKDGHFLSSNKENIMTSNVSITTREQQLRRIARSHPIRSYLLDHGITTVKGAMDALSLTRDDAERQITILKRARLIK
jgi:hypothetical protein